MPAHKAGDRKIAIGAISLASEAGTGGAIDPQRSGRRQHRDRHAVAGGVRTTVAEPPPQTATLPTASGGARISAYLPHTMVRVNDASVPPVRRPTCAGCPFPSTGGLLKTSAVQNPMPDGASSAKAVASLRQIRTLPDHLVNQIAAGEKIDQPAAALEGIAGERGGRRRPEPSTSSSRAAALPSFRSATTVAASNRALPLAIARHATSKIASFDDLESVTSFGFRGEALA